MGGGEDEGASRDARVRSVSISNRGAGVLSIQGSRLPQQETGSARWPQCKLLQFSSASSYNIHSDQLWCIWTRHKNFECFIIVHLPTVLSQGSFHGTCCKSSYIIWQMIHADSHSLVGADLLQAYLLCL